MNRQLQYIPMMAPIDIQAGATDCDSINTGKLKSLTVLIMLGLITGNDATFRFYGGATAGAKTTEFFPKYRISGADVGVAGADVFGARAVTPAGGIIMTDKADYESRVISVDIESDQMPDGLPWLTVATDDGSASVLLEAIIAVAEPRYEGDTVTTAL